MKRSLDRDDAEVGSAKQGRRRDVRGEFMALDELTRIRLAALWIYESSKKGRIGGLGSYLRPSPLFEEKGVFTCPLSGEPLQEDIDFAGCGHLYSGAAAAQLETLSLSHAPCGCDFENYVQDPRSSRKRAFLYLRRQGKLNVEMPLDELTEVLAFPRTFSEMVPFLTYEPFLEDLDDHDCSYLDLFFRLSDPEIVVSRLPFLTSFSRQFVLFERYVEDQTFPVSRLAALILSITKTCTQFDRVLTDTPSSLPFPAQFFCRLFPDLLTAIDESFSADDEHLMECLHATSQSWGAVDLWPFVAFFLVVRLRRFSPLKSFEWDFGLGETQASVNALVCSFPCLRGLVREWYTARILHWEQLAHLAGLFPECDFETILREKNLVQDLLNSNDIPIPVHYAYLAQLATYLPRYRERFFQSWMASFDGHVYEESMIDVFPEHASEIRDMWLRKCSFDVVRGLSFWPFWGLENTHLPPYHFATGDRICFALCLCICQLRSHAWMLGQVLRQTDVLIGLDIATKISFLLFADLFLHFCFLDVRTLSVSPGIEQRLLDFCDHPDISAPFEEAIVDSLRNRPSSKSLNVEGLWLRITEAVSQLIPSLLEER